MHFWNYHLGYCVGQDRSGGVLATPLWCLHWGGAVQEGGPGWSQSGTEQLGRGQGPGRTPQISGFSNLVKERNSRGQAGLGRALEAKPRTRNPSSAVRPRRGPKVCLLKSRSAHPCPSLCPSSLQNLFIGLLPFPALPLKAVGLWGLGPRR